MTSIGTDPTRPMAGRSTGTQQVAVALSGGVDSSTAAALLVQQGYQVSGVTMRLWAAPSVSEPPGNAGSTPAAIEDARRVCAMLGIPFHLVDLEEEFKAKVVGYFCDNYALGRTPNPCLVCNRDIKFGTLLRVVRDWGADYLATGHYARIRLRDGQYQLLRGVDGRKDQSYMLYSLGQEELPHLLFPLGDRSKSEVRAMATAFGLPTASRAESQDACFLSRGDYRAFLARERPETTRPGPILDLDGHVLGEHRGIAFHTVGQRQGMGLAAAHPLYVVEIDPVRNALIVGPKAALLRGGLLVEEVHFVTGRAPPQPVRVTAKIRYKAAEAEATLVPLPERKARVIFAAPQPAVAPGQGVVFYQDEVVVGGGIITSSLAEV